MLENLKKLERLINSELSSKILNTIIENDELLIEITESNLLEVVQFLKSDKTFNFRQLKTLIAYISDSLLPDPCLETIFPHLKSNSLKTLVCFL